MVLALLLAASAPLPSYPDALRCAALSQAAFEPVKHSSRADSAVRYDHLIFWSMAASEVARKSKRPEAAFEADMAAGAKQAAAELASPGSGAAAELARCDARVPPLKPSRR